LSPNRVSGSYSTVGGGLGNYAGKDDMHNLYATVGGGSDNTAYGDGDTVGGGSANIASGTSSTVAGGDHNDANAYGAAIGGGTSNIAGLNLSTIAGGSHNTPVPFIQPFPGELRRRYALGRDGLRQRIIWPPAAMHKPRPTCFGTKPATPLKRSCSSMEQTTASFWQPTAR